MSENNYLDTHHAFIWEGGERVELQMIRAVNVNDAHTRVLKDTPEAEGCVEIHRYRAPSLVASPSDKLRRARRLKRTRAPQYYAKRRKRT